MLNRIPMKHLLVIIFITFGLATQGKNHLLDELSNGPIANAGPNQTIYLTETSTATLNGSASSGSSYQWTEVSTDYQSGGSITSPNSSVTHFGIQI